MSHFSLLDASARVGKVDKKLQEARKTGKHFGLQELIDQEGGSWTQPFLALSLDDKNFDALSDFSDSPQHPENYFDMEAFQATKGTCLIILISLFHVYNASDEWNLVGSTDNK